MKHHKLLEDAAHSLDTEIATQRNEHLTSLGQSLKKYDSNWHQVQDLKNKLQLEEGCLIFSETQSDIVKHAQNIHEIEQTLSSFPHKARTPRSGLVTSALDTVLNKHRKKPQAYHSRSFVGNRCHKYLQAKVYSDLIETLVNQTKTLTNNPFLIDKATIIQITFDDLNNAFSAVHNALSHTKRIDHSSLSETQATIDTYMAIYRRMFPHKVIPKRHLLEQHCIPYIKIHKFGLGLLGEQGTENSHQMIGNRKTQHTWNNKRSQKTTPHFRSTSCFKSPLLSDDKIITVI